MYIISGNIVNENSLVDFKDQLCLSVNTSRQTTAGCIDPLTYVMYSTQYIVKQCYNGSKPSRLREGSGQMVGAFPRPEVKD